MSSLKMTFSLASLILIFGLVFVPVSVMADDGGGGTETNPHGTDGHTDQAAANTAETDKPTHMHPVITITDPTDANPNTATIEVVDKAADNETGRAGTIEFDVMVKLPSVGLDTTAATGQIAAGDGTITGAGEVVAYARTAAEAGVGDGTGGAVAVTVEADTTDPTMVTLTFTISETVDDDADADTTEEQERAAGIAALIKAGLYVDLYVKSGAITVNQLVPTALMQNQGNLQSRTLTVQVIAMAVEEEKETPDPIAGMITGTPDLTQEFPITITFAESGVMLVESDIGVVGCTVVPNSLYDATPDDAEDMTVWMAAIRPFPNPAFPMLSVTLKTGTDSNVKAMDDPATTDVDESMVELSRPSGTLNSITASTGADDTAAFSATLTFAAALPEGVMVEMGDLMITPATAKVGTPTMDHVDATMWHVLITPTAGTDTVIGLSDAGMVKFAYAGSALTVMKKAVITYGDVGGSLNAAKTEVALSGTIGANGFASVGYAALPNLAEFFRVGGTITLTDAGAAKTDHPAKTVVISEILWGLDLGEMLNEQNKQQFIELYNTSASAVDLTGWKLVFSDSLTVPANDVDQVSNIAGTGWLVDIGQSGRWAGTSNELSTNTQIPISIVSMYRNIDYTKVEKVKDDGTADPNREEQLKGVPGGNAKGSWKASTKATRYAGIYDSMNAKHSQPTFGPRTPTSIPRSPFIINEIGNDTGGDNDWVELHNISDAEASLKNYQLSVVTGHNAEAQLFHFHDKDYKVPSKGYIVVSSRHPNVTDLAAGKDVSIADDQEVNSGASHLFVVRSFNIPDGNDKTLLILRNNHEGKHLKTAAHIVDVVGTLGITDDSKGTKLWPLVAITGAPHGNVIDGGDESFKAGLVYRRANTGGGTGEKHLAVVGYTGVGYDRAAENNAANGGTPGYENGAVKDKVASLAKGEITISEIMLDVGVGRQNLPQWVELHNSSMTQAVSLSGWKLHLENASPDANLNTFNATLSLGGTIIYPNQTVLIVTTTGRTSDPDHFPNNRVINIWTTKAHRDAVEMSRRADQVISMKGFNLTLVDKDNKVVDEAGNLDGARRTRDEPAWVLPMGEDDDRRSSLLRVYDEGIAVDGTMEEAWVLADSTNLAFAISQTYYGDADDFGTPGFRAGGPLPVSLSKFRPERLATGEIVIRWITESELNNAGFNILRSETRNGEYTQLNTSLIAGQGTTSERTTYSWMDKSAKPNVVYYYQIQDVSLDGQVQTLRQSRLKGHVSPAGKLTTQWAEIKALQ